MSDDRSSRISSSSSSLIDLNGQLIRSQQAQKKRFLPLLVAGIAIAARNSQNRSKKKEAKKSVMNNNNKSTGDKTIDEMIKWVKDVMSEYSKGDGQ